jgi:hypothetical protein
MRYLGKGHEYRKSYSPLFIGAFLSALGIVMVVAIVSIVARQIAQM